MNADSQNTRGAAVQVHQATLADVAALAPLFDAYRQFYQQASDLASAQQFLQARLSQAESVVFVAFVEKELIGFTQLYPCFSSVSLARIWILNDLYVAEAGRQQGAGHALISAATTFAKDAGAVRLSLSTAMTNTAAQRLYQGMGWTRDEVFLHYQFSLRA